MPTEISMSNEISIHDNFLLYYTVDCHEQRITLRTAYLDGDASEHTDVIFSGVAAYHFERDNFGTILFGIEETSPEQVYADYHSIFESNKNYGWPKIRYDTEAELLAALEAQAVKGFLISSSYGMDGFVLAQVMQLLPSS